MSKVESKHWVGTEMQVEAEKEAMERKEMWKDSSWDQSTSYSFQTDRIETSERLASPPPKIQSNCWSGV
jgi:hypothetical protein